ncbi:trigger factor [Myxococcota bacterium]|nr:trigger factor [Myxococcota bacterium]MBU1381161.1 trigger factor [Myxococcota bacterium]MBU1496733.1 trigger factor [Myxococcota bacterium]
MTQTAERFNIETPDNTTRILNASIGWPIVKEKFDETFREIAKNVSIKGFRRGKVPRSILEKMFRKHVERDIVQELIRTDIVEILQKNSTIRPVGDINEWKLEYDEVQNDTDFPYKATFEVIPDVTIENYKGIDAKKYTVKVKDSDVEKELEHLREHMKKSLPVEEGTIEAGHILSLSIMGKIDSEAESFENQKIAVPENMDSAITIPQLVAFKFLGKNISDIQDEEEVEINFPESHEKYAGKTGNFFVEFTGVRRIEAPELNDDFAKETQRAETLEELKSILRSDLDKRNEEQSKNLLEKEILGEILKVNSFDLGDNLIGKQAEMKVQQTLMGLGFNTDGLMGDVRDNLISSYKKRAEVELRENLVLESISRTESIEVSDEEIESKINEIAEEEGKSAERIKADYLKENRLDTLRYYLKISKTLDFLKSESKITEVEVEEFPAEEPQTENEAGEQNS